MLRLARIAMLALLLAPLARAEVPLFDRPQAATFNAAEVYRDGDLRYARLLRQLRSANLIERDDGLDRRVQRLFDGLVRHVADVAPDARALHWEVHVTRAADIDGMSMGSGKILVGRNFIESFALDDAGLAMVLAHEMAHVLANHAAETYSAAYDLAYTMLPRRPFATVDAVRGTLDADYSVRSRLGFLSRMQELEADSLGYVLAVRAGYRGADLLRFFDELAARDDARSPTPASHPDGATRRLYARAMKLLVDAGLI
jgi:predicted Zn-dependent protease